jgi:hypothetical protein
MSPKRPDLELLRKDTLEVITDPEERARVLRDLDELEKLMQESDAGALRARAASLVFPYKPAPRTRLAVILVLCTLIALVVAGIWLPQVLDSGSMTSADGPVTAKDSPVNYWISVGAGVVSVMGCAFGAVFALLALVRYPNHPFRRAGSSSVRLGSVPVDPLAEAEVYIAYGRKQQAMQILEGALKDEPRRKDLSDKLAALRRP